MADDAASGASTVPPSVTGAVHRGCSLRHECLVDDLAAEFFPYVARHRLGEYFRAALGE